MKNNSQQMLSIILWHKYETDPLDEPLNSDPLVIDWITDHSKTNVSFPSNARKEQGLNRLNDRRSLPYITREKSFDEMKK